MELDDNVGNRICWPPKRPDDVSLACASETLLEKVKELVRDSISLRRKRVLFLLERADTDGMEVWLASTDESQHGFLIILELSIEVHNAIDDVIESQTFTHWHLQPELIAEAINAMDGLDRSTIADDLVGAFLEDNALQRNNIQNIRHCDENGLRPLTENELTELRRNLVVDMDRLQTFHKLMRLGNVLNV